MENILKEIVENKQVHLDQSQIIGKFRFYEAIKKDGLSIIGEVKKASPSKGIIIQDFDPIAIGKSYEGLADAVSVLTEEKYFLGSNEYLRQISKLNIPTLKKDFIISSKEIVEAKELGASAILLIVGILTRDELKDFYTLAKYLEMDVLTEVHNEKELEIALDVDVDIIGINNRNLKNFSIDLNTTKQLAKFIPRESGKLIVSESGIKTREDIEFLKEANIDGILVGESFMRAKNRKELIEEFKKC